MMSREVRAALRQLKIRPLPADIGSEESQAQLLARLRHEYTNYDQLHRMFRFEANEHRMFRWAVNQRILAEAEEAG